MNVITFVTAYDLATNSNRAIAEELNSIPYLTLFEKKATSKNLKELLQKHENLPVFVMSHGEQAYFYDNNEDIALDSESAKTLQLLRNRSIYVFACHTAAKLAPKAAQKGTIYWGYNFQITAPDEQKEVKHLFVNLFLFIYNYFHLSTETTKIENFLVDLEQKCEETNYLLDQIYEQYPAICTSETYRCVLHIWSRLRVFVPNRAILKHPKAPDDLFY